MSGPWPAGWPELVVLPLGVLDSAVAPTVELVVDPVVDDVRRVMSDGAYDYTPSFLERILERIGELLGDLFSPSFAGPGASFGGGIGGFLAWILIAAAVVGIVAVIVTVLRRRVPRRRSEVADGDVDVEHRRPASEWAAEAAEHEAAGRWPEAVRARYRELVRRLIDRRQLSDVPGLTTRELRVELDRTTTGASIPFDTVSTIFELAWYALWPTGADDLGRLKAAAAEVLDAPRAPVSAAPISGGAAVEGSELVGDRR